MFREAKEKALIITTNVFLCGSIHVEQLTLVVNFDLPVDYSGQADSKAYIRRIARTGGFRKSVVVVNFVSSDLDSKILHEIEKHFDIKIERLYTDNYLKMQEKIGDE